MQWRLPSILPSSMSFDTVSELGRFGAASSEILFLRPDTPKVVPFLDLIPSVRRSAAPGDLWPEAIIVGPFGATAYVVRHDQCDLAPDRRTEQLRLLQRRLAPRDAGTMLVVVSPSSIDVMPLGFDQSAPSVVIPARPANSTFFRQLATGALPWQLVGKNGWRQVDWSVAGSVASLIVRTTRTLQEHVGLDDAMLLVARTMFIRLLLDRGLAAPAVRQQLQNKAAYDGYAVHANRWFDQSFDGEILRSGHWNYQALLGRPYDSRSKEQREVDRALSAILVPREPPSDGASPTWSDIDFSIIPPILVAEAFERAIARLERPTTSRSAIDYTPATLARFIAEEAIQKDGDSLPTVFATSADCGQLLVAALEQLAIRDWDRRGVRPSGIDIRHMIGRKLCGPSGSGLRSQLAAAVLSLAALELSPEPFPLSAAKYPSPLPSVFGRRPSGQTYDLVIGDHGADRDYGRDAFARAIAATRDGGIVALCVGNRLLRRYGARLPGILRGRMRLHGVATGIRRPERDVEGDVVIACNEKPSPGSEFWLTTPFAHEHVAPGTASWIDASHAQPISQKLAEEIPGLLAALPNLTALELGVLLKVWRKLATPPAVLALEDPSLAASSAGAVADSSIGRFLATALGGTPDARINFPTVGLAGLDDSIRTQADDLVAGRISDEKGRLAIIGQLCGLDPVDLSILGDYPDGALRQSLAPKDYGRVLADRLCPFWAEEGIDVSLIEQYSSEDFHVFDIRTRTTARHHGDSDWQSVNELVAKLPAGNRSIVSSGDGGLMLQATGNALTPSSAWIAALDILRNHANQIGSDKIWPND